MNILDNLIAWIDPERAYKRDAYRFALEEQRANYDAGGYGRVNNNWNVFNQSGELTDRTDRDVVRARARDLERNSDMMNGIISAYKRNVFGGGYTLQAKTGDDDLNEQIETAWKRWCKKQNCDLTGRQSFNQIMRMAVERKKVDGGILFIKVFTKDKKLFVPFQIQAIEVDQLDNTATTPKNKGNRVVGGIEFDQHCKPVGYWFKKADIEGFEVNDPVYYDAKQVIYYFTLKRPTQVREMSDVAQSITRIRDANEFMTAVSVKERIAACLSVFIKKQLPVSGIGRPNGGIAPTKKFEYDGKTISPGMIKELNAGDEIQVINPNGQSTDAAQLIKLHQRLVGSGQGLSYEATSRDVSEANYSSVRHAMIEDEETYTEDRELLLDVMTEIFETFVISAVLKGVISIPKFWNDTQKYLNHEWIKAPKPWIDPAKEANANKIALSTGQKTYKEICAENGRDWRKQLKDQKEVLEYAQELGLEMGGVIYGKASTSKQQQSYSNDEGSGGNATE